jgi:hypothetical protein
MSSRAQAHWTQIPNPWFKFGFLSLSITYIILTLTKILSASAIIFLFQIDMFWGIYLPYLQICTFKNPGNVRKLIPERLRLGKLKQKKTVSQQ